MAVLDNIGSIFGLGTAVWVSFFVVLIVIMALSGFVIWDIIRWNIRAVIRKDRSRDSIVARIARARKIKSKSGWALKIKGFASSIPYHESCFIPLENKKGGTFIDLFMDKAGDLHPLTFASEITIKGTKYRYPSIIPEDVDVKAWAAYENERTESILQRQGIKQIMLPMMVYALVIIGSIFVITLTIKYATGVGGQFAETFRPIANAIAEGKFG